RLAWRAQRYEAVMGQCSNQHRVPPSPRDIPAVSKPAEEDSPKLPHEFGGRHETFTPGVLAFGRGCRRRPSYCFSSGLGGGGSSTRPSRNGTACDMAKHRVAWG